MSFIYFEARLSLRVPDDVQQHISPAISSVFRSRRYDIAEHIDTNTNFGLVVSYEREMP
jgi:hypothetical protein